MNRIPRFPPLVLGVLLLVGAPAVAPAAGKTFVVRTTTYPLQYLTQRIGGPHVDAACLTPADQDPALWMPDASTIQAYQAADLILINGATFESWLPKVSFPFLKLVDTTRPSRDRFLTIENAVTHSHGTGPAHSHRGTDGHTWLDPSMLEAQAGTIKDRLTARDPGHRSDHEAGYRSLAAEIDALDTRLEATREPLADRVMIASHPSYNYLARSYGWTLVNRDIDPDVIPTADLLAGLREAAPGSGPILVLFESRPPAEAVTAWRHAGFEPVHYDPCEVRDDARIEAEGDFLTVMNANVTRLLEAAGH